MGQRKTVLGSFQTHKEGRAKAGLAQGAEVWGLGARSWEGANETRLLVVSVQSHWTGVKEALRRVVVPCLADLRETTCFSQQHFVS